MGPMNSAFMHCSQMTGQQLRLKKKKKKRENANAARLSAIQTYTKPLISHVKKKTNFVNFDQISQSYHIIYIYLYIKPKPLLSPQFSISTLLKLNK